MKRTSLLFLVISALAGCDAGDTTQGKITAPPPAAGEVAELISGCTSCHGADGVQSEPEVPFIAGLSEQYLAAAMHSYVVGDRQYEPMRLAIVELEPEQRQDLARYYAKLQTPWQGGVSAQVAAPHRVDPQLARAGKALARPCMGCHGDDGNSVKAGVPSLAGLEPAYFMPALKAYLTGERHGAQIMKNFKHSLRDSDIRKLAAYFAEQKRRRSALPSEVKAQPKRAKMNQCIGCHGEGGNSTHPEMPTLAGQNADYLLKAMTHYRDSERKNPLMIAAMRGFKDSEIRNLAVYFASREPRAPGGVTAQGGFDPMADGTQLAASCNGCHGPQGNSEIAGIPRLAGLQDEYLRTALRAYRDGTRQHANMTMLTRHLSDTDIEKIALYYASQAVSEKQRRGKGNAEAGQAVVEGCTSCHGAEGNSEQAAVPSLAGQDAAYLEAALLAYQGEGRPHEDMRGVVAELDNKALRNVAAYFARQSAKPAPAPRMMEAPEVLAEKCTRCHGKDGREPVAPDKPRIAGQRQDYLLKALQAYHRGERIHSTMQAMSGVLSLVEMEAIAAYYAAK
jgi:cytochrome c553